MKKFEKGKLPALTKEQIDELYAFAKAHNISRERFIEGLNDLTKDDVYLNDKYQVNVRHRGDFIHLSIKRIDKGVVFDWREMQQIKNELVSPESEGVQLFPAESRLVDTANQYHIWVLVNEMRFPLGFDDKRLVDDHKYGDTTRQRKFNKSSNQKSKS